MKTNVKTEGADAIPSSDLLDREFEAHIIKSFNQETGGYSLTFDNGWSFWMPEVGFAPEVGQTAKLYGRGTGYTVRGLVVNDRVVFYRTEAQQEELHRKEQAEREAKKRTDYDAKADDYNRRVSALPPPFTARINGFRNWKPETWKYDYEPYELFTCEQAVEIANALKTPDEISRFHKLEFVEQKKLVPALSDDHSGNTFGAACHLASIYLTKPDLIPSAHGALCPLVGCKDYGCVASRSNE
jgi:hypothetical protein